MIARSFGVATTVGVLATLASIHAAGAARLQPLSAAAAAAPVTFDVKLPLRKSDELDALVAAQSDRNSPTYHHYLTTAQFKAAYGPTADTIATAIASLKAQGFTVSSEGAQLLHVSGSATAVSQAFKTQLGSYRGSDGRVRVAAAIRPQPTPALTQLGATIVGLSSTIRPKPLARPVRPDNRYHPTGGYWFDDLKQAYSYPSYRTGNGKGVTIATVGQADFSSADATEYFAHEKLGPGGLAPAPVVKHVLLPGADAFDPNSNTSFEANLDVQQSGGSAPGATIVGVSVNGPGEPFLEAYAYLDESNAADIVSTSYGECELYFTAAYNNGIDQTGILLAYHDLFRQGNAQGITFTFSSGDNSDRDCFPVGYFGPGTGGAYQAIAGAGIWVDDPNTTGVGGTNLLTTAPKTPASPSNPAVPPLPSKYVGENAIADTVLTPFDPYGTGNTITNYLWGSGNGRSTIFKKPYYQALGNVPGTGRSVPDISMHMGGCPNYGATIKLDCGTGRDSYDLGYSGGSLFGAIGTSASSPEFAGALAVLESLSGQRYGNINPFIYAFAVGNGVGHFYHTDIASVDGEISLPHGRAFYNPIIGVGTPDSANIARLVAPIPELAGDPQTASNP